MGGRLRRSTVVVAVASGVALAAPPAAPAALRSSESGIRLSPRAVVIDRATVRRNLISVSPDGTFTFRRASKGLAHLRPGSVMLLQGADAVKVTAVRRSHGKLLVRTHPAAVTEVIKSGHISFSGAPVASQAFLSQATTNGSAAAAQAQPPGYPYFASTPHARAASSLSAEGKLANFGYSLTVTPSGGSRTDVTAQLCYPSNSVCGGGPPIGLSAQLNLAGYFDVGDASGAITINGGSVTESDLSIQKLSAGADITYSIGQGEGTPENADPPVFTIPATVDFTVPGSIPLYLKLQMAVLLKLGVSSKNATVHGGVEVSTSGSDTIEQHGSSLNASQGADTVGGEVLDQSDGRVPPSISLAPSGVVVAVQFPKLGMGLGVSSLNGIAYVDVVSSIGQTVGSAIAGMLCSSYDVDITANVGVETQIGPFSFAGPRKTVFEKMFQTHDPGCPQV
jgi:hypothetical protein